MGDRSDLVPSSSKTLHPPSSPVYSSDSTKNSFVLVTANFLSRRNCLAFNRWTDLARSIHLGTNLKRFALVADSWPFYPELPELPKAHGKVHLLPENGKCRDVHSIPRCLQNYWRFCKKKIFTLLCQSEAESDAADNVDDSCNTWIE